MTLRIAHDLVTMTVTHHQPIRAGFMDYTATLAAPGRAPLFGYGYSAAEAEANALAIAAERWPWPLRLSR